MRSERLGVLRRMAGTSLRCRGGSRRVAHASLVDKREPVHPRPSPVLCIRPLGLRNIQSQSLNPKP